MRRKWTWVWLACCPRLHFVAWYALCPFLCCTGCVTSTAGQSEDVAVAQTDGIGRVTGLLPDADLQMLFAIQQQFSTSSKVQQWVFWALQKLATSAVNRAKLTSTGGLRRVYTTMSSNTAIADVQEAACASLRNLAEEAECSVKIVSTGGCVHLFAAMAAHPASPAVQYAACETLRNLVANLGPTEAIGSPDCLERLYNAMAAHTLSVGIQEAACATLHHISRSPAAASQMQAGGRALVLVSEAISAHPSNDSIQMWCQQVLKRIQ